MNKLTSLYKKVMRVIFGFEYYCVHDDADGTRKVFHCETLREAQEWMSCSLNCSTATVICRNGYLVQRRYPTK